MTAPLITVAGPKNARTDPETGLRHYTWHGRELVSVTSARRVGGVSWPIHQWSISQVINHVVDNIGPIAGRLSTADPAQVQLVKKELRAAATKERDLAAKLGTDVHKAVEQHKALTDVSPEVAPRLRQYQRFLLETGFEIVAQEFQVWNLELGYAGSVDLLGRARDGSLWLPDLKTGKGLYGEHALQLIAYLMAEFVGQDDVVDVELTRLLHQVEGIAILHLAEDSWEFHRLRPDPATWRAFRGLLDFALWMETHESIESISVASRKSKEGAA